MTALLLALLTYGAPPIEDPIRDYLEHPTIFGDWEHTLNTVEAFRADVSGDGLADVFVRSVGDPSERIGRLWTVYESTNDHFTPIGTVSVGWSVFVGSLKHPIATKFGSIPPFEHRLLTIYGGGKPAAVAWLYIRNHSLVEEMVTQIAVEGDEAFDKLSSELEAVQIESYYKPTYLSSRRDGIPTLTVDDPVRDYFQNPTTWGPRRSTKISMIETFRGDASGDGRPDVFVRNDSDPLQSWIVYESVQSGFLRLGIVELYGVKQFRSLTDADVASTPVPPFKNCLLTTGSDSKSLWIEVTRIENHRIDHHRLPTTPINEIKPSLQKILLQSDVVKTEFFSKDNYMK